MKKMYLFLISVLIASASFGAVIYQESQFFVKVTLDNAISKWFSVNTDNVGLGLVVISGVCKVEVSLDSPAKCENATAVAFDSSASPNVSGGAKRFESYNGLSCARVNCSSGSGEFYIRRH